MRNDGLGKITKCGTGITTLYAGGSRGPEARANGDGGLLERGYYSYDNKRQLHGPILHEAEGDGGCANS